MRKDVRLQAVVLVVALLLASLASPARAVIINEVMSSNDSTLWEGNTYPDWVEIYNDNATTVDISGWGLKNGATQWQFPTLPALNLAVGQRLVVFCSGTSNSTDVNHLSTNFKISSGGATLVLVDQTNATQHSITVPALTQDVSYGYLPDGNLGYPTSFVRPTPGAPNLVQVTNVPMVGTPGGYYPPSSYPTGLTINVLPSDPGSTVRYTTNSTEPTETSPQFVSPMQVNATTVLRLKAFRPGYLPSNTVTHTYLLMPLRGFDVACLSISDDDLHNNATGIYEFGPNVNPLVDPKPWPLANFQLGREVSVGVEMFDAAGHLMMRGEGGAQIGGNFSTTYPLKSFNLNARQRYGYAGFPFLVPPFATKPLLYNFQRLVLRNGGNDFESTLLRETFFPRLLEGTGLDYRAYRPMVVFLNGAYLGLMNLHERITEHFLAENHGVNQTTVELLENNMSVKNGSKTHFQNLTNFLGTNSTAIQSNYDYAATQMDMDNFLSYNAAQIFMANLDWPGNNRLYWRPATSTGKWKWIMTDLDYTFDLYHFSHLQPGTSVNSTALALDPAGPTSGGLPQTNGTYLFSNPTWSTYMLRKLMDNQGFKFAFINRLADFMNYQFAPERVNPLVDSLRQTIVSEIDPWIAAWKAPYTAAAPTAAYWQYSFQNRAYWESEVNSLKTYAAQRPTYVRQHIINQFGLAGSATVQFSGINTTRGSITINSLALSQATFTGQYFQGVPITITASAKPGYVFLCWTGSLASYGAQATVTITPTGSLDFSALFVPVGSPTNTVTITEINYASAPSANASDWVELVNTGPAPIHLGGWTLRNSDNATSFVLPQGTVINPGEYLVLAESLTQFQTQFPTVSRVLGNFGGALPGFSLASSDTVRLFDGSAVLIDGVAYTNTAPWPTTPDQGGPTLSLRSITLDNSLPGSWRASIRMGGTPGRANTASIPAALVPILF